MKPFICLDAYLMVVYSLIKLLFLSYTVMLIGRIIGSWFPVINGWVLMRFVVFYTEPYLKIFRRIIPPIGMMDLSPLFAFIALQILEKLILGLIRQL